MIRRSVWVTHRFAGFHRWPGAPEERRYLRDRHRHLFHVKAEVDVEHLDREVEFHDLLDLVTDHCTEHAPVLGSCESIAEELARALEARWPGRRVAVDVSEDGENGASVLIWRR